MTEWTGEMTDDSIVEIQGSVIQHGKYNDRVYLMSLNEGKVTETINSIEEICFENAYTKVFAKVPANCSVQFILKGYKTEAYIPKYFSGKRDVLFMTKYFSNNRSNLPFEELSIFNDILNREISPLQEKDLKIIKMSKADVVEMAELYKQIFSTYPFPITDSEYLKETMGHIHYYGFRENGKLIALSSSETDKKNLAVEMTDFAVLPECRGRNISSYLLMRMEKDMKALGFKTFFTIARLKSPGMNLSFIKNGYRYSGTLINNTNISGNIESMNVFYKMV